MQKSVADDNSAVPFPEYLQSFEALREHFGGYLAEQNTTEKGRRFAELVRRLIPQTDFGSEYELPELSSKESNDEGVDLTAMGKDGHSTLYVQAKLAIHTADSIDTIVSKFMDHGTRHHPSGMNYLFPPDQPVVHYAIVTLAPLERILRKYGERQFATRHFFDECANERRIHIVDGHAILAILQSAFTKVQGIATSVTLNLAMPVVALNNVYFGIISSSELQALYKKFGDALFFENVRDFLEPARNPEREGRTTVNAEIIRTVREHPERMLELNNGVVFRAATVNRGESDAQLRLSSGSIVNGCQTTMCIIENASTPCFVPIKIVQTDDSWEIAKSANYQNPVDVIDLDIARNLRPQLAKRAAASLGVQIGDGGSSAIQIIDAIYDRRVTYEETRLLYIGLFSKTPNNVFATNYTELLKEMINRFSQQDPSGERIFDVLFRLQGVSQAGMRNAEQRFRNPEYARKFKRFFKDQRPSYRCFVSILALCAAVGMNIADRAGDDESEYMRIQSFFSKAAITLETQETRFLGFYRHAVKEWMREMIVSGVDDREVQQEMATRSKRADFKRLYTNLLLEADDDDSLHDE